MTVAEFKIWFDGFLAGRHAAKNGFEVKILSDKIAELEESEPVFEHKSIDGPKVVFEPVYSDPKDALAQSKAAREFPGKYATISDA